MGANCGAKTSAARLAAASLPIRSMGHKRSLLQKVSPKFCGQPKSRLPRYQYLDWSKASLRVSVFVAYEQTRQLLPYALLHRAPTCLNRPAIATVEKLFAGRLAAAGAPHVAY